jgi:hypothetical protein
MRPKVWFVGANLLYYAQLTNQNAIRNYIRGKVLEGTPISGDGGLPALPVQSYTETPAGLSFDYESGEAVRALVSYTYSPAGAQPSTVYRSKSRCAIT